MESTCLKQPYVDTTVSGVMTVKPNTVVPSETNRTAPNKI